MDAARWELEWMKERWPDKIPAGIEVVRTRTGPAYRWLLTDGERSAWQVWPPGKLYAHCLAPKRGKSYGWWQPKPDADAPAITKADEVSGKRGRFQLALYTADLHIEAGLLEPPGRAPLGRGLLLAYFERHRTHGSRRKLVWKGAGRVRRLYLLRRAGDIKDPAPLRMQFLADWLGVSRSGARIVHAALTGAGTLKSRGPVAWLRRGKMKERDAYQWFAFPDESGAAKLPSTKRRQPDREADVVYSSEHGYHYDRNAYVRKLKKWEEAGYPGGTPPPPTPLGDR